MTATALTQNLKGVKPAYTIQSVFDGSSPQTIDNLPFDNDPTDPDSGSYTLRQATTLSLNTVFGKLTSLVKPENVVKTARAMGIPAVESASGPNPGAPTLMRNGNPDDYVGIGNYPVRIMDQAVGYATLANGGLARPAYFVEKITDSKGNLVYQHKDKAKRVLDKRVANDTTLSMEEVAQRSDIAPADGRPVAAKTGTVGIQDTADSSDGWTVGFTPQVSVASWVGSDKVEPIYDENGNSEYGRDLAGSAWQRFMDGYLRDKPVQPMPTTQQIGQPSAPTPSITDPQRDADADRVQHRPAPAPPRAPAAPRRPRRRRRAARRRPRPRRAPVAACRSARRLRRRVPAHRRRHGSRATQDEGSPGARRLPASLPGRARIVGVTELSTLRGEGPQSPRRGGAAALAD